MNDNPSQEVVEKNQDISKEWCEPKKPEHRHEPSQTDDSHRKGIVDAIVVLAIVAAAVWYFLIQ